MLNAGLNPLVVKRIREMLNAGLNPLVVKRIMGDSFQVIEKHYGGFEQDRASPFALQLAKEIEQRID
jgi:hypothetical protein